MSILPQNDTVRLATFNIRHCLLSTGQIDLDAVVRDCRALDADVLALQEVDVNARRSGKVDQGRAIADALRMAIAFGPAHRLGIRGRYGNALLVRGHIGRTETYLLPRRSGGERRAALVAEVTPTGRSPLTVGVTHLSVHRDDSALQLEIVLRQLVVDAPSVFMADCNRRPHEVQRLFEAKGFTVAETAPTYPAEAPRLCIDYIAVRNLEIVSAATVPTTSSDHLAVVAVVADTHELPQAVTESD